MLYIIKKCHAKRGMYGPIHESFYNEKLDRYGAQSFATRFDEIEAQRVIGALSAHWKTNPYVKFNIVEVDSDEKIIPSPNECPQFERYYD